VSHPVYPPKFPVPDEFVPFDKPWPEYDPILYTNDVVFANACEKGGKWADAEIPDQDLVNGRKSYEGEIIWAYPKGKTDYKIPQNPQGRTGMIGRGLLGKWGPNHAADPIVTRLDPATGKPQVVVVQRKDTGTFALPGGMVDYGEQVSTTIMREFTEETGNLSGDDAVKFVEMTEYLFKSGGKEIYRGYVDDVRNTDHSWIETDAIHFHCNEQLGSMLPLNAGDDASNVMWLDVEPDLKLHANHADWVRQAVSAM